jgi:hypothetical protein
MIAAVKGIWDEMQEVLEVNWEEVDQRSDDVVVERILGSGSFLCGGGGARSKLASLPDTRRAGASSEWAERDREQDEPSKIGAEEKKKKACSNCGCCC